MNASPLIAAALVAIMTAGCAGAADKSGGESRRTTLVLASNEGSRTAIDPALAYFVERVEGLSDGRVELDLQPKWFDHGEQHIIEDVAAGKASLGWSGTRAFDLVGVTTFQPLHAPFLVNSYAAEKAVVADPVAQEMLAGLDEVGLTGLAVLADELRFPAAAQEPLLEPDDFANREIGAFPSRVQAEALTALGARVTDDAQARESSWPPYLANHAAESLPIVTANAVLWPRTTVLFANPADLGALASEDRAAIQKAAAETAAWSIEHADDRVPSEMATACGSGTRIAMADQRQLSALRDAVEPVYAGLRADPAQAAILSQVEKLVQEAGPAEPVEVPPGCAYRPRDTVHPEHSQPDPLERPGRPGDLPAGTYRYVLTEDEINAAVPPDDAWDFAGGNAGVWTWVLGDGRWRLEVQLATQELPEGFDNEPCEGYYDVHGHQVDFTTVTEYVHGDCLSTTWKAMWRETDGGLAMESTTNGTDIDFLVSAKTWERID